jgi:hypothetical protein
VDPNDDYDSTGKARSHGSLLDHHEALDPDQRCTHF